jgi:phosphoribosylaminoimidazole-succinocarboxamide synthase
VKKGQQIYEGKAKKIFSVEGQSEFLWQEFKDSLTAFNAQKKGNFDGKGSLNRNITSSIFRYLNSKGIASHWVQDIGDHEMITMKLSMVPLEVVVRNIVAGSLSKRLGIPEGKVLDQPVAEFFYKNDALEDPFINDEHALLLGAATRPELTELRETALKINQELKSFFNKMKIDLVDFKIEFGRDLKGKIILADEITPDSCRLWQQGTQEKLDKDRFRRDLGKVDEAYKRVWDLVQANWSQI